MRLAKQKFRKIKVEDQSRLKANNISKRFLKYISKIIDDNLIIDSNIWMDENYGNFFRVIHEACLKYNNTLKINENQLDEINNLNDGIKSGWPKIAINRIEKLKNERLLEIQQSTICSAQKNYSFPTLIELIFEQAKKDIITTFITNDKELRIKARKHLKDYHLTNLVFLDSNGLLRDCNFYVNTMINNISINQLSPH